jgi:hypothetical protein
MAEPFIPFVPSGARVSSVPAASAGLKVLPPAEVASPFSPVPGSAAHLHGAAAAGAPQPKINVQRDGDKITGIRIECACGHVIDLACSY